MRLPAIATIGAILSGCAQAQDNAATAVDVPPQPQPEVVKAPPAPVDPAPFVQTVWREGQNGALKISGPIAGYVGALQVLDSQAGIVWSGGVKAGVAQLEIPVSRLGFYTLKAGDKTLNFAVVPSPKTKAQQVANRMLIGLCTHFAQRDTPDEAYRMLQTIGIDAVRDEMGWAAIEKQKGVFTFPARHEEYNAKLKRHGIPLHWSASYGNPIYPQAGGRYPAAEAAAPFGRHIIEVLKKFGDNIIAVEILNEPNKVKPIVDYLPVLRATHQQVRAAGFKQSIVAVGGAGPAGGGMAPGFARALFEAGGAAFADGFSQHPYMTPFPPDSGYASVPQASNLDTALSRAGDVVAKYNLRGSWITELGWPSIPSGHTPTEEQWADNRSAGAMVSEPKQAAFTARTILGASRYPHLRGLYIYDFQDDGPIPLRREHRFGLVRQDLQPKMGFQAFVIAMDFLRDKTFVRRFHAPDSLLSGNLYRDKQGELWLAVWTTEVTENDVRAVIEKKATDPQATLPKRHMDIENTLRFRVIGATPATGYDWQGGRVQGAPEMTATSLPQYLRVGRDETKIGIEVVPKTKP